MTYHDATPRVRTVETATPLTEEELFSKLADGWRFIGTVERVSKTGARYMQYRFTETEAQQERTRVSA